MSDPASPPPASEPAPPPKGGRKLRACCALLVLPAVIALAGMGLSHESAPSGVEGPKAEALTARVEEAVNLAAWQQTQALRWSFAGIHDHLWDRQRGFARVARGERKVLLVLAESGRAGRAWEGERELAGEELAERLEWAWTQWCNDSFWLNPIAKMRDEGTARLHCGSLSGELESEAIELLMVRYSSGGVTPGDRYVWEVSSVTGLPRAWKMWVSILPVGGVDATWEGWETLSTGAKVSTDHRLVGGLRIKLTGVEGAKSLAELEPGPDPFAPLLEGSASR